MVAEGDCPAWGTTMHHNPICCYVVLLLSMEGATPPETGSGAGTVEPNRQRENVLSCYLHGVGYEL